jgi:plastocyanin
VPHTALLATLLVAAMAAAPALATAEDHTIALTVTDTGFAPVEVEAPAGGRVRIEITNKSSGAIEFESFELNRERVIQVGQTVSVYVTGLSAGRYAFFDDFHQERKGTLVVR